MYGKISKNHTFIKPTPFTESLFSNFGEGLNIFGMKNFCIYHFRTFILISIFNWPIYSV